MFSKLLKLTFRIAITLALAACSRNIPVVSIVPTRTVPVQPTSHPVSVVTLISTQAPALEITPASLPIPTSLPGMGLTSPIDSLPLPGVFVNHLALDDQYIYWTESGGNLFRYPLVSSKSTAATILARTQFVNGILSGYPDQSLIRVGDWLNFDDRLITEQPEAWALRAINVVTQTEREFFLKARGLRSSSHFLRTENGWYGPQGIFHRILSRRKICKRGNAMSWPVLILSKMVGSRSSYRQGSGSSNSTQRYRENVVAVRFEIRAKPEAALLYDRLRHGRFDL